MLKDQAAKRFLTFLSRMMARLNRTADLGANIRRRHRGRRISHPLLTNDNLTLLERSDVSRKPLQAMFTWMECWWGGGFRVFC
jgi:hypothetical protein